MSVFNGVFPILPGKEDEARSFVQQVLGPRREQYDTFQARSAITRDVDAAHNRRRHRLGRLVRRERRGRIR